MKAAKGELFVCQRCQTTFADRAEACHPYHCILVEASVTRDEHDRVIDCTQSSGKQPFRVAKVST